MVQFLVLMLKFPFRPVQIGPELMRYPVGYFLLVEFLIWGINFWINVSRSKTSIPPWYLLLVLFIPLLIWMFQISLRADGMKVQFVDLLKIYFAPGLVLGALFRFVVLLETLIPGLAGFSRLVNGATLLWSVYIEAVATAVLIQHPVRKVLWAYIKGYLTLLIVIPVFVVIPWLILT